MSNTDGNSYDNDYTQPVDQNFIDDSAIPPMAEEPAIDDTIMIPKEDENVN